MRNSKRVVHSTNAVAFGLLVVGVAIGCTTQSSPSDLAAKQNAQALAAKSNWLQFGGDSLHGSNNTLETQISPQTVGRLQQLFKVNLPETIEGAPVVLTNVSTASGTHDVAFVTTRSGYIVALDAYTGQTLWSKQASSTNITMSSPAIDPSLAYVYSNGLDGYIHKYSVGTGVEVHGRGGPSYRRSRHSGRRAAPRSRSRRSARPATSTWASAGMTATAAITRGTSRR